MKDQRQRQTVISERWYYRQLMKLVRHIQALAAGTEPADADALVETLRRYSETLRPWAHRIAARMVGEIEQRERNVSLREVETASEKLQSTRMYAGLRRELREQPSGVLYRQLMQEQVELIASLPREVAERVQKIASESAFAGATRKEVITAIQEAAGSTRARARLIARTETSRAFATLTEARARSAGSTQYIWRTINDPSVRETHQKLNGRVFSWDDPPVAELDGTRHHPGRFPNCRCTAQPLYPKNLR